MGGRISTMGGHRGRDGRGAGDRRLRRTGPSGGGGGDEGVDTAPSSPPKMPDSPVTLNVLDVAGNLQLTKAAIEKYREENPKAARRVTFTTATAPELSGKVKAQQKAGPARHRPRADRHRRPGGRHRAGPVAEGPARVRRQASTRRYLEPAAKMQEQAEDPGVARQLLPVGPAARVRARPRQRPADDAAGAAGLGEGEPRQVHVRAAVELRPGADVPHGPALPARRQGPAGPDQRLGQDVGLPEGARQVRRVLPLGHQGHDVQDLGRRVARHDPRPPPAGTSTRARSAPCPRRSRSPRSTTCTGSPTRTTWSSPRASPRTSSRSSLDLMKFLLDARAAGALLRRRLLLPRARRSRTCGIDMAPAKSQKVDRGVRPARVRAADRVEAEGDAAARQGARRRLRQVGPRGRRLEGQGGLSHGRRAPPRRRDAAASATRWRSTGST